MSSPSNPTRPCLHQWSTAQPLRGRSGTQSTKPAANARWCASALAAKGTDRRARRVRSARRTGKASGVTPRPQPRTTRSAPPRDGGRLALGPRSPIAEQRTGAVVDSWTSPPRRKDALKALSSSRSHGRCSRPRRSNDEVRVEELRNIPSVHCWSAGELNAYDNSVSEYGIFTKNSVVKKKTSATSRPAGNKEEAEGPSVPFRPGASA